MASFKIMRRRILALFTGKSLLVSSAWPVGLSTPRYSSRPTTAVGDDDFLRPSPVNVRRYGAVLDGSTNDLPALSSALLVAGTHPFTIVIDGPMALASSLTIPSNVTIEFVMSGAFVMAGGKTANFSGIVKASPTHIFQGSGTVAFSVNKQRTFYAEWWGAKGDSVTDDYAALNAAMEQVSNAQGTLQLVGAYVHRSVLVIPANAEIVGYGKSFGTKLIPTGAAGISFNSTSIRSTLRRCVIELGECTSTNGVQFTGGAYNCVLEDVFVHGLNSHPNNSVGIDIGSTKNTVLNRVSVYGSGAGAPLTGMSVGSNAFGVLLVAPDVEACFYGIHATGTAQCDIITPYLERCSGYSIYVSRNGAGGCTIRGGDIEVANSRTIGIGIAPNCSNVSICGTAFTLNGGTGITNDGTGSVSNVNIYDVAAANIVDPHNYFNIYGIGGTFTATLATGGTSTPTLTGSWSRNGKSVTLSISARMYTSNASGMTVTGVPKLAQPLSTHCAYCNVTDNGVATAGEVASTAGGILTFYKGQARTADSFSSAGIKGFGEFSITYTLE